MGFKTVLFFYCKNITLEILTICFTCNSRYGGNWMKKSLKNLNKVMCNSVSSVFKEDDDCS